MHVHECIGRDLGVVRVVGSWASVLGRVARRRVVGVVRIVGSWASGEGPTYVAVAFPDGY